MKKAVDVIERTLEKDKKSFIFVCRMGEVFSILILVMCIIGALAAGFMSVMYILGIAIDSEFATPHIAEEIYCMINGICIALGLAVTCNFSVKIFNSLKTGDTPFKYDIADKIKGAGITLIVTGLFGSLTEFIHTVLIDNRVFLGENTIGIISGCEDMIILSVILMSVAYIFNYGCKLQQESDETL